MGKRIRSAKGEMVDFDLLTIKAQIAAGNAAKAVQEPAVEVHRQENFIDKKLKRKIARTKTVIDQTNSVDVEPRLLDNK